MQTALGQVSKVSCIRCRWDSSTPQPGTKLSIKQHEKGGAAFEKVSWNLGRKGEGRIIQWSKIKLCVAVRAGT